MVVNTVNPTTYFHAKIYEDISVLGYKNFIKTRRFRTLQSSSVWHGRVVRITDALWGESTDDQLSTSERDSGRVEL